MMKQKVGILCVCAFIITLYGCNNLLSQGSTSRQSDGSQPEADPTIVAADTLFTIISNPSLTTHQKQQLAAYLEGLETFKTHEAQIVRFKPNTVSFLTESDVLAIPVLADSIVVAKVKHMKKKHFSNNTVLFWEGFIPHTKNAAKTNLRHAGWIEFVYTKKKGVLTGSLGFYSSGKCSTAFRMITLGGRVGVIVQVKHCGPLIR